MRVDLPAPLGPSSPISLPRLDPQVHPAQGDLVAVALLQSPASEGGRHARSVGSPAGLGYTLPQKGLCDGGGSSPGSGRFGWDPSAVPELAPRASGDLEANDLPLTRAGLPDGPVDPVPVRAIPIELVSLPKSLGLVHDSDGTPRPTFTRLCQGFGKIKPWPIVTS